MVHMTNLSINQEECLGCGMCASLMPELFNLDLNVSKAKLKTNSGLVDNLELAATDERLTTIEEVIQNCPAGAIKLK